MPQREAKSPDAEVWAGGVRPYAPLSRLQPIAEDLWWVDGPPCRMAIGPVSLPFTTRMVVARLASKDLWLWSPTAPTPELIASLAPLGRVAHLVSPNRLHYAFIGEWQRHFPDAIAWASPGVRERAASQGIQVRFDRDLGEDPEPAWAGLFDQHLYRHSRFIDEVIFFHRPSRTLVLADLIQAIEPKRLRPGLRWVVQLAGGTAPGGTPADLSALGRIRPKAAHEARARIRTWAPERLVVAHGQLTLQDAQAIIDRALRWMS